MGSILDGRRIIPQNAVYRYVRCPNNFTCIPFSFAFLFGSLHSRPIRGRHPELSSSLPNRSIRVLPTSHVSPKGVRAGQTASVRVRLPRASRAPLGRAPSALKKRATAAPAASRAVFGGAVVVGPMPVEPVAAFGCEGVSRSDRRIGRATGLFLVLLPCGLTRSKDSTRGSWHHY